MPRRAGYKNIAFNVTAEQLDAVTAEAQRRGLPVTRLMHMLLSEHVPGYDANGVPQRGTWPRFEQIDAAADRGMEILQEYSDD